MNTSSAIVAALCLLTGIVPVFASASVAADRQTPAQAIGPGFSPDLAIDPVGRKVHLIYRLHNRLLYRVGDFSGKFGAPEVVMTSSSPSPSLWDPRIVLDRDQVPHVVVADGHLQNENTWYLNRHYGTWKTPTVIFNKEAERLDRATMPHLVIEPDGRTAFIGAFTVGGPAKGEGDEWGILARVENLENSPKVVHRNRVLTWNPQLVLRDGELWVGGRNIKYPDRYFVLQQFDQTTLEPIGKMIPMSGGRHGEIARLSVDASGDIHAAGTLNNARSAEVAGWYNTLSRARAGQPPIIYLTTNRNASGAGRPIRDIRAADRVYLLHWHGAVHDHHEPKAGTVGNYLHYARIENGEKIVEGRKISDRLVPHGNSYRHTPAMAAHPDGGMFVIVEESGDPNTLYFSTSVFPVRSEPLWWSAGDSAAPATPKSSQHRPAGTGKKGSLLNPCGQAGEYLVAEGRLPPFSSET